MIIITVQINKLKSFLDNVLAQLNCGGAITPLLALLEIEVWQRHWRHFAVFLGKTFTLTMSPSTQMYKLVPMNLILGVVLR